MNRAHEIRSRCYVETPIAYRGKDERVERVLMYYCTSSLLALVQDAAEEPSTYCFADTLETKRDALSARRGSCQKSKKPIPTPCAVFRDRNPLWRIYGKNTP